MKPLSLPFISTFLLLLLLFQDFADASSSSFISVDGGNDTLVAMGKKYRYRPDFNCSYACSRRCSQTSRKKVCLRACGSCCNRCNCVPPGTYGNKHLCPCYARLRTHGNKPKCP